MVMFQNPDRFRDKNRYQGRKIINRIISFVWSVLVFLVVASLLAIVGYNCMPWLRTLWDTIGGKG